MAGYYQGAGGDVVYVGNEALNPDLIAGRTRMPDNYDPYNQSTWPTNGPINSDNLNPGSTSNYQTYNPSDPYNIQSLSPIQQREQSYYDRLIALNEQSLGQGAYRRSQEQNYGIPGFEEQQTKLLASQQQLRAKLADLQNEAANIPSQMQTQAEGRGITAGGLAPLTSAELRNNSEKQRSIASEALTTSALLDATNGDLLNAQRKVDRAVSDKYDAILEEIKVKSANLDLFLRSPEVTADQQRRAEATRASLEKQATDTELKKSNAAESQKIAISAASYGLHDPVLLDKIAKADPVEAQRLATEAGYGQKPVKADITAAPGTVEEFKLLYNRMPTSVAELNQFAASRSAAGRAPKIDEPLSTVDIGRINDLYGVTVPFGTTQKQAESLIAQSNTPEAKIRTTIQQLKDAGATYDEIIKELPTEPSIKDKELGKKIATEVYGITPAAPAAPIYGRGSFTKIDINDRVAQLKSVLGTGATGATNTYLKERLQKDGYPISEIKKVTTSSFESFINSIGSFLFG